MTMPRISFVAPDDSIAPHGARKPMTTPSSIRSAWLRRGLCALLAGTMLLPTGQALAAAALADQPLFGKVSVPGNLALALSVEFPTVVRVAHQGVYSNTKSYRGLFDPEKCYSYVFDGTLVTSPGGTPIPGGKGDSSYFQPSALATNRQCNSKAEQWSGNFLNWATLGGIDSFSSAMTGGRRVVDNVGKTIVEKAWNSGQGLFPTRSQATGVPEGSLPAAQIEGATPFRNLSTLSITMDGKGYAMHLSRDKPQGFEGKYFHFSGSAPPADSVFAGTPVTTRSDETLWANFNWGLNSPVPGVVNADGFASEYNGTFRAPETGTYYFQTETEDGARLWINGTLVVDRWSIGSANTVSAPVQLTAGQNFTVRMRQFDVSGTARAGLQWRRPSDSAMTVFNTSSMPYTIRVRVCDPNAPGGVESNCVKYPNGDWKPEGLIQQYAQNMRFSAFGYMNDNDGGRDGGVLRARQKFVGQRAGGNPNAEWDPLTGIMVRNPDKADADNTATWAGVPITDSGVINYLHGFGQILPGPYKAIDPVNELYYATLRYFRGLGNVPAWSTIADSATTEQRKKWLDGFPIIRDWTKEDPITSSCQRNYVLGIGDIYTHQDKNVPGNTVTASEWAMPPEVSSDTVYNAVRSTNTVKAVEGMGENQGTALRANGGSSTDYMAGLAFEANVRDLRPAMPGKQSVQTYWVDVLEAPFQRNNKFYLAAKYGGLDASTLPANVDPYTWRGPVSLGAWATTQDTLTAGGITVPRPDNYFTAGNPDAMVSGLRQAFQRISAAAGVSFTSAFSTPSPEIAQAGSASYAASYDPANWTGSVTGNLLTFDADGKANQQLKWRSDSTLEQQAAGTGWDTARRIVTTSSVGQNKGVPFRLNKISSTQKDALVTRYGGGNDAGNYLNWLRGDRSRERSDANPAALYRKRDKLLGDIVNSRLAVVGAPSLGFSDAANPGYAKFKRDHASRAPMVYVGANDGMLHAFDGALEGNGGQEAFAYVPSFLFSDPNDTNGDGLLAKLGNPGYLHRYYVDASPLAFDIDFSKTEGAAAGAAPDWRTVLIGGLGKGGKGFYALDVSDPAAMTTEEKVAGKVLWEFKDDGMGFSYGAPTVVKTAKYGWVALLTSGYNSGASNGYLYVVNPRTGKLLQKIPTAGASDGMTHASAYVADFSDGTADAVYVGDLNGKLWRFDLSGTSGDYPNGQQLAELKDANGNAQPITSAPLIEIHPKTRKRYVLVGTGRLLDTSDLASSAPQSFYAIADGTAHAFDSGITSARKRSDLTLIDPRSGYTGADPIQGWYFDLGVDGGTAWRVAGQATSFNGMVAFSSLNTTGDTCNPSGSSRVYAMDFDSGKTALASGDAYASSATAIIALRFTRQEGRGRTDQNGDSVRLGAIGVDGSNQQTLLKAQPLPGLRLLNWREVPTVD